MVRLASAVGAIPEIVVPVVLNVKLRFWDILGGSCWAASPPLSGWPAQSAQSLKPVPIVLNVLAQTLGHVGREVVR